MTNTTTAATTTTAASTPPTTSSPASCCGTAGTALDAATAEHLAGQLGAVADPVRLQVLSILANAPDGEVCACDFVGPIDKSQPTISHHLKVLAEAGLVEGERRGRWIWYRLAPTGLDGLVTALNSAASRNVG